MKKTKSIHSRLLRIRYFFFCLGKIFCAKKKDEFFKGSSNTVKKKKTFTAIDDAGKEVLCTILFSFENDEGKHYIVYTDNSRDEEDNIKIYASIYDPKHGDEKKLLPIETVEEWTLVENLLANIQTMVKMGKFANLDGGI